MEFLRRINGIDFIFYLMIYLSICGVVEYLDTILNLICNKEEKKEKFIIENLTFNQINLIRDGYKGVVNGIIKLFIENEHLIYLKKEKEVQLIKKGNFKEAEKMVFLKLENEFKFRKIIKKEEFYASISNTINSEQLIDKIKNAMTSEIKDLIEKKIIKSIGLNLLQKIKLVMLFLGLIIEFLKLLMGLQNNKPVMFLLLFIAYTLGTLFNTYRKKSDLIFNEYVKKEFSELKKFNEEIKQSLGEKEYKEKHGLELYSALFGLYIPIVMPSMNDNNSGSSCGSSCGSGCGSSCGGCGGCGDS